MTSTLINEICDDHELILARLTHFIGQSNVDRSVISGITAIIGAHHLAEEETLYQALQPIASEQVGQAQVYHLVLDDLIQAIEIGGLLDESLQHQLMLLQQLLCNHFQTEEMVLLELANDSVSMQQQLMLGRQYRQKYQENLNIL